MKKNIRSPITKPTELSAPPGEIQQEHAVRVLEASDLSPERITEGAENVGPLFTRLFAQSEDVHPFRHWGINE